MAISTDVTARQYFNVVAATPIAVDYPLFDKTEVDVFYGNAGVLAVLNTDYQITLSGDFSTFVLTPLAALITKINALIAANPTGEQNTIVARRDIDYLTSTTPAAVRDTGFTSTEFDRTIMRLQQLAALMDGAITYAPNVIAVAPKLTVIPSGKALIISPDGTLIIAGPDAGDIANAAPSAAAAVAAAAAAVPAATTATAAAATATAAAVAAQVAEIQWQGNWVGSGHAYFKNDAVRAPSNGSYIAASNNTSGALFATDLAAGKWQLLAQDGISGAGTGDMLASVYDPTTKHADAFAMANMVEGSTQKIMTDVERTKLSGVETGAQLTNQARVGAAIATANKSAFVDADDIAILDSATSFLLKYISGTALKLYLKTYFDTLYRAIAASIAWSAITGTPNTLAGYGIVDGGGGGVGGPGTSWKDVSASRAMETAYQNTTGVGVQTQVSASGGTYQYQMSANGSTSWINMPTQNTIIPPGWYHRLTHISGSANAVSQWMELKP